MSFEFTLSFLLTSIFLLNERVGFYRWLAVLVGFIGIVVIYGIPFLREIPIYCAEKIAEKAVENKLVPILYLVTIFVLLPLLIILAST